MRVVADSNIIVSALQFGGKPEKFLQAAEEGRYVGVSEPILSEVAEVLLANSVGLRTGCQAVQTNSVTCRFYSL